MRRAGFENGRAGWIYKAGRVGWISKKKISYDKMEI